MAVFLARPVEVRDAPGVDYIPQGAGMTGAKRGTVCKVVAGQVVPWAAATDTGLVILAGDASGVLNENVAVWQLDLNTRFEITLNGVAVAGDQSGQQFDLINVAVPGSGTLLEANRALNTNPRVEVVEPRMFPAGQQGLTGDTRIRVMAKPLFGASQVNWK